MTETLEQNRTSYNEKIERIRANRDLSREAKRRMMAEAYHEALAEHQRIAAEDRGALERRVAEAERKVLGISYPEGARPHEKAIIAMSYRDARDRAERVLASRENPEALGDLLERAEKSGDDQLAEAAFHVATLQGRRKVADAYLQARPKVQRRWESYVAARQEADSVESLISPSIPPSRPPELGGAGE